MSSSLPISSSSPQCASCFVPLRIKLLFEASSHEINPEQLSRCDRRVLQEPVNPLWLKWNHSGKRRWGNRNTHGLEKYFIEIEDWLAKDIPVTSSSLPLIHFGQSTWWLLDFICLIVDFEATAWGKQATCDSSGHWGGEKDSFSQVDGIPQATVQKSRQIHFVRDLKVI